MMIFMRPHEVRWHLKCGNKQTSVDGIKYSPSNCPASPRSLVSELTRCICHTDLSRLASILRAQLANVISDDIFLWQVSIAVVPIFPKYI